MRTALVRSVLVVRIVEGLLFLRKLFVVLAVIATAVFLSPALGVLLALVAFLMWSGGAGLARAFGVTTAATLSVEGDELVVTGRKVPRRIPLAAMRSGRATPDGAGSCAHVVVRGSAAILLDADVTRRAASCRLGATAGLDGADPELVSLCTQHCNRNLACLGCSYGSCVPTCLNDGLKSRPCGAAFVAWQKCFRAHSMDDDKCGSVPAWDAEYCAYATCGAAPGAPVPSECH